MGKEKLIWTTAVLVLLLSSASSLYVYAMYNDSESIDINGTDYTIDQLFYLAEEKTIESNDEQFAGIALDDLIKKIGIADPNTHEYTLIAADGYQKTVQWENMKNGILTEEAKSVFSDLPKAYRIKDIVQIEVN